MISSVQDIITRAARRQKTPLWLVGGPIRDELVGAACHDWDFAGRQARVLAWEVAKHLRATFIVLDDKNKIYRVVFQDITLDFAELQGKTIEQDLGRRDFTINAMARVFPDGKIIDPFNGQKDLRQKKIRAVSERAFIDDPLRTVRAFRFAAQLNGQIESQTLAWIGKHRAGLAKVSPERIREELLRLWKQPAATSFVRLMDKTKLLTEIFPEIEACRRTAIRYYGKGGVLKHSFATTENLEWIFEQLGSAGGRSRMSALIPRTAETPIRKYLQETVGAYPRAAWLKWAAFLHDFGKPATAKIIKGRLRFFEHDHVGAGIVMKLGNRLRLSRQETYLLSSWVRNHMRIGNLAAAPRFTDRALSRFFRDLGEDGVGMILISLADHYDYLRRSLWGKGRDPVEKVAARLLASYYENRAKILPPKLIDGHVLMKKLKIKPGPIIGRLLEAVQDAQSEGKVTTAEEAVALARKKVQVLKR